MCPVCVSRLPSPHRCFFERMYGLVTGCVHLYPEGLRHTSDPSCAGFLSVLRGPGSEIVARWPAACRRWFLVLDLTTERVSERDDLVLSCVSLSPSGSAKFGVLTPQFVQYFVLRSYTLLVRKALLSGLVEKAERLVRRDLRFDDGPAPCVRNDLVSRVSTIVRGWRIDRAAAALAAHGASCMHNSAS